MQLDEFYPSPDELIGHEAAVLEYLRDDRYLNQRHPEFARDAGVYLGRNKGSSARFEFFSWIDLLHSEVKASRKAKFNTRLVIAALIERGRATYSNVSYCFAVCNPRSGAIIRKFHFDITATPSGGRRRQPHPRCHLQYCGEIIPDMIKRMGVRGTQLEPLHPSLSEPRIFLWPVSLALLVDMAFHEFRHDGSEGFRNTAEWRRIVRSHEAIMLRPFFEKCVHVIKQRGLNNPTLADAFDVH